MKIFQKTFIYLNGWLPDNGPRAIQNSRFVKNINAKGYLFKIHNDPSHNKIIPNRFKVIDTYSFYYKFLKKVLFKIKFDIYTIPDKNIIWAIVTSIKSLLIYFLYKPETLISISKKDSSHIPPLLLKIINPNLKWLVFINDPWLEFNFYKKKYSNVMLGFIDKWLYKKVILNADKIIVPNHNLGSLIKNDFASIDENKIVIRKHYFDESVYENFFLNRTKYEKLNRTKILSHIGDFYGQRSPMPLLLQLKKLAKNKNVKGKCKFNLIGRFSPQNKIDCIKIIDEIKIINLDEKRILFTESIAHILNSDILIVFEANKYNLPYKLTEYIGMDKIIWGIGEIDGALYSEMKCWNSLFSDIKEPNNILKTLDYILSSTMDNLKRKHTVPISIRDSFSIKNAFSEINALL